MAISDRVPLHPRHASMAAPPRMAYMGPMNEHRPRIERGADYDADLCAWAFDQARLLRRLRPPGLDWENLAEEIDSLGRSDKRAVGSALKIVLEHLIKWTFQPERRSASWSDSIDEHRDRIGRILEDCPSLVGLPAELLEQEYRRCRRKALRDARLSPEAVPVECPFTAEQALDPDFWPA
jgi:hypothetical protein